MSGLGLFIIILIFVVAILLGIIVLIQNPKGGGLASNFGAANQIGGVRRTADFLEKATWGLAIALVLLCLASTATQDTVTKANQSEFGETPEFPDAPVDAAPVE
ncbi:MAG: preprotein translocase subunit SecG [Flavobacteriales bacterium]|nr:preprotein translocase subunit SecG [Flavobacteriales bacterium]